MERTADELLRIQHVGKEFGLQQRRGLGIERKVVHAVDDVSFSVRSGESFGIVGESGSGKSTLARLILGLDHTTAGNITFQGQDVGELCRANSHEYWRKVQVIFQDPFSSLNPRMKIGKIIAEPLRNYSGTKPGQMDERIRQVLELVGLPPSVVSRYPHELSGGQRQRVAIAAALAIDPQVIVADEAVSALDVSVQAQIVNLLLDLRKRLGLTYVFITHDLNLSAYFCDRIAVLYLGQIMEICEAGKLLDEPLHPYTQALISAVPSVDVSDRREHVKLVGEIPSPIDPPKGCPFHPRCSYAVDLCQRERPVLQPIVSGHSVACHVVAASRSNMTNSLDSEKWHED